MLTADRKATERALRALKSGVARRPGIPALTGVLVEAAGDGSATMTATDLEVTVRLELEATGEPARFLVPFALFADTVKAGTGERVEISPAEASVRVDGAEIRLLPAEDFPTLSGDGPAYVGTIEAGSFARGAAAAVASASKDEARPVLTGVLLEFGVAAGDPTTARMVSTDSYRLHVAHVDGSGDWAGIVPARAVKFVATMLGRKPAGVVSIAGGDSEVRFILPDGLEIRSRIIEGEFPNWRQLVPERGVGAVVRYELAEFLGALKAAKPYCKDTSPVRLEVTYPPADVELSASSPDLGSWSGRLERVTVHGPAVSVAFNPTYLAGVLEAAGDGGALEIRDGLKPATAWAADGLTVGLVMPVRLPAPVVEREPAKVEPEPEPEPEPINDVGGDPEGPFEGTEDGGWRGGPGAEREPEPVEDTAGDWQRCEHGYGPAECHVDTCPNVAPAAAEISAAYGVSTEPEPEPAMHRAFGIAAPAPIIEGKSAAEPEPVDVDAVGEAAPAKPEPEVREIDGAPAVVFEDPFGRRSAIVAADSPAADAELERMRAELEAARAMLERVKAAETAPARPDVGGFTDWAELAEVGTVGAVHVRVVGGPDGRAWVDVRRYAEGRKYAGRTKAGTRVAGTDAAELARIIGDAAEQAAELEAAGV
jgi:DNA polymerase III subunit beta